MFVCALSWYPAIPGWVVRCGCVFLGSGLGCAPPFLARMLGCVFLSACSACTPTILALMDSNVCEMYSKKEAYPNARAISAGLISDKEYTATFLFTVLWVSFCKKQR